MRSAAIIVAVCLALAPNIANGEPCIDSTDERAAMAAQTPAAVIAAVASGSVNATIETIRDRIIVRFELEDLKGHAYGLDAIKIAFALRVCDIVRLLFLRFDYVEAAEVHLYVKAQDIKGIDRQQEMMWAAYLRRTAMQIQWVKATRNDPLSILRAADGVWFNPVLR